MKTGDILAVALTTDHSTVAVIYTVLFIFCCLSEESMNHINYIEFWVHDRYLSPFIKSQAGV